MTISIKNRASIAFSGNEARDDVLSLLDRIRENWKEVSHSLSRTTLLMLALAATFELLTSSHSEMFTLGPFTFTDVGAIQKSLTVLVAFLYLELFVFNIRNAELRTLHDALIRLAYPRVWENGINVYLEPPSRLAFFVGAQEHYSKPQLIEKKNRARAAS